MNNPTHEQRVWALAEEMAIAHYLKHPEERAMKFIGVSFSELPVTTKDKLIQLKMDDANIAIKYASQSVRQALYEHNITDGVKYRTEYLVKKGLMPNEEETEFEKAIRESVEKKDNWRL